jgi:hypothetical protein
VDQDEGVRNQSVALGVKLLLRFMNFMILINPDCQEGNILMNMTNTFRGLVVAASLLLSVSVFADTEKHISHSIDASDLELIQLEFPVGELEIESYDGDEIQLEIDIKAKRRWFAHRRDVSEVELDVSMSGNSVRLEIDEDKTEQIWVVKIPAALSLEVDLGVGEIQIRDFTNDLDVDLGVGSVMVEVSDTDYDSINVSSGVGDAKINGFPTPADNKRKFISAEASYDGEGEPEMDIEVGVGDVQVKST